MFVWLAGLPAMFKGPIDFYHFILLSLTLIMGSQGQRKVKLGFIFTHLFSTDWDEIWYGVEEIQAQYPGTVIGWDLMKQMKQLLFYWLYQKRWYAFRRLWTALIQTWCDDRYYHTLHFDTSLTNFDLDSLSHEYKKAKPSVPVISQNCSVVLEGIY